MLNQFILQTVDFLVKSDLKIHDTEFREIIIVNGSPSGKMSFNDSLYASARKLSDNTLLHTIILFSLLDGVIDNKYPELEGKGFYVKYKKFPDHNDQEKIIKELYRVFKLIRNAAVHSKNGLVVDANKLLCSYTFKNTQYHLEINKTGLELMYTLIFKYASYLGREISAYDEGIMRKLYDDFVVNVIAIQDEIGSSELSPLSEGVRLKRNLRYRISGQDIQRLENGIKINLYQKSNQEIEYGYGYDYQVSLDNIHYTVPEEALTDGFIMYEALSIWK